MDIVTANNKVVQSETNYLNGIKGLRHTKSYYCKQCKAWHTTTISNPVFK